MSLRPKHINFASTWERLQDTILGVITVSAIPKCTWNDRFTDVYALCVAYPEPLGDKLYWETKNLLETHVDALLQQIIHLGDDNLLANYYNKWKEFSRGINYLHMLYSYFNNQHIKRKKLSDFEMTYSDIPFESMDVMQEIGELGLNIWKRRMIEPLQTKLVDQLLDGISYDRISESKNETTQCHFHQDYTIKGVIDSFVSVEEFKPKGNLELYEDIFEKAYLQMTSRYYSEEAQRLLQLDSISKFMSGIIQMIDSEAARSRKYIYPSSYTKVTSTCEDRMVGDHIEYLHSECREMVLKEHLQDVGNMYKLLKTINGAQKILALEFESYIEQCGLETIAACTKEETMAQDFVENFLAIHNKYSHLIKSIFEGSQIFTRAMDKACSSIINHRSPKQLAKSPELLARYCDLLLKKNHKGLSEQEVDDKLANVITVFKYLDDKDIFQKFYSRNLGKRLIHQLSHSMDLEESMINRLKLACGYEFTKKFHRMLTDISLADDYNLKFTNYLKQQKVDLEMNYFIRILQQGTWPLSQTSLGEIAIPLKLQTTMNMFEQFYAKLFSGRKLTWLHHLSNGDVRLGYLNKAYIVNMSTFQMSILLSFENSDQYAFKYLLSITDMNEDQLVRNLQSLIDSKLLNCNHKDITSEASIISLNLKYTNKRTKLRIVGTTQKDTSTEDRQTIRSAEDDRKMFLQAAIVRIMKNRKILKHNCLIQEVVVLSVSRFSPSVAMIKKCIESLIEKNCIERTNNSDEYSYIA